MNVRSWKVYASLGSLAIAGYFVLPLHRLPLDVMYDAKTLSLKIVAEGIELPEQRDRLRELHCDVGQGFLFSRPLPAGEAAALLEVPEARAA
jgi:predicted signal transduction protein with EAL and GGDEF domain